MRNYVAILPLDDISNAACEAVAAHIQGTIALPHAYGRLQFGEDLDLHFRTMIGTGANPNVAACIVIGIEGGWTLCTLEPGLNLGGPLRADASGGNTGVFINGRELHSVDVLRLQQVVPVILPGRWWLDAYGNFGYEGGMMLGNVLSHAFGGGSSGSSASTNSLASSVDSFGAGGNAQQAAYDRGASDQAAFDRGADDQARVDKAADTQDDSQNDYDQASYDSADYDDGGTDDDSWV